MKLDPNCVRDVLLFLEAQPYVKKNMDGDIEIDAVWLGQISEKLTRYPEEVIYYALSKLHEGEYIDMTELWADDHLSICCVNFITYNGHTFLEQIKPEPIWEKTIRIAAKLGIHSLPILGDISGGLAGALICTKRLASSHPPPSPPPWAATQRGGLLRLHFPQYSNLVNPSLEFLLRRRKVCLLDSSRPAWLCTASVLF